MFEWSNSQPDSNVQEAEYQRLLGFPADYVMEGRSRDLADQTRAWYAKNGRPWIYVREIEGFNLSDGRLRVNGAAFSSQQLHDNLASAQAHGLVTAAVSAGRECEERAAEMWRAGKPDEYFFMEMFGSAVVEHLVTVASGRICSWADGQGMVALPHYSPGYSGWDVADQCELWKLIRLPRHGDFPGDLHVMESGMLTPKKSLLTVFGVTRHMEKVRGLADLVPCQSCSLPQCQYRRAPYQHSPLQIEDVRQLQSGIRLDDAFSAPALARDAKYMLNGRALRKWARERLRLNPRPDGSVEALFSYEGTTCSNLGHPLLFDYRVVLGPPGQGYRILESSCAPAPGDTGNEKQCVFIQDSAAFMNSIDTEKPLLGQSLNEVLSWDRPYAPSGCFCYADRRAHKWGLVLEVIHFALVQQEMEREAKASAA